MMNLKHQHTIKVFFLSLEKQTEVLAPEDQISSFINETLRVHILLYSSIFQSQELFFHF